MEKSIQLEDSDNSTEKTKWPSIARNLATADLDVNLVSSGNKIGVIFAAGAQAAR
jgi:hypothetical protein